MKPRISEITRYFLKLGSIGFGGPVALVAYMHRDLVERRAWFTEQEYRDGLALSQLAPGPLAAQLATYLGWSSAGVAGATAAAIAFVLPSLLIVLALSALYVRYGGLPWMAGAFYGIGAAVIGIIAKSCIRLARKSLEHDYLLWAIFVANALFTAVTSSEKLSILLGSGLLVLLARMRARPVMLVAVLIAGSSTPVPLWVTLLGFFAKASLVVFGSGLAVLPFLYGGVVEQHHWLTDHQFLDAVAVSMITPGPVVITVAFIGYLIAGLGGALAATVGIFMPMYLVVVLAAPFYTRIRDRVGVRAFVEGITAGATGALAGAVVVLGRRAIVDIETVLFCVIAFALLSVKVKIPEPVIIVVAGIIGVLTARH